MVAEVFRSPEENSKTPLIPGESPSLAPTGSEAPFAREIPNRSEPPPITSSIAGVFDPAVIRAGRSIYRAYCDVHPDRTRRPLGVAVDRKTFRGKLIFDEKPILLPHECFVPIETIDRETFEIEELCG